MIVEPAPPYSFGQAGAIQPRDSEGGVERHRRGKVVVRAVAHHRGAGIRVLRHVLPEERLHLNAQRLFLLTKSQVHQLPPNAGKFPARAL